MKKRQTTSKRKTRLPPHERRSELVAAAAKLLTEGGLEALEFTAVAAEARVTRPVVYKFFPTRTALVEAILADFEDELTRRFFAAASGQIPSSLEDATRIFIDPICETIETKGAGAWELLGGHATDAEIAALGRAVQARLMKPWYAHIAEATGASKREVRTVSAMLVAAGRAVLAQWYAGELSRAEAARDTTRGVSALLAAFTRHRG
jgi:AcrR family transcriptional regulator